MITYLKGDIFSSPAQVLVNTVNTVGVMGKGVALEFKKRYPAMFKSYERVYDEKQLEIGNQSFLKDKKGRLQTSRLSFLRCHTANALPTAEGAIQIAMEELPITLHDARVLVIGFGRLGQALAPRLRALGARVWVAARRYEQRAAAESMGLGSEGMHRLPDWLCGYDLVLNTVPAPVLGARELNALKERALVIDLASRPGGVDMDAAAALGVRVIWALSLPGKVAPVTAGRYIKDTIYHIMEESNL